MTEITNYKLIDFLSLPEQTREEYFVILRYLKPIETKERLFYIKLKHVERCKEAFSDGMTENILKVVAKLEGMTKEGVLKMPILRFFGLLASIRDQLKKLMEMEKTHLTPLFVDKKWQAVEGSEKMSIFGIYNTLEALSGGDALKYKAYMNLNYSEIFTILYMRRTLADLQHQMSLIKTK